MNQPPWPPQPPQYGPPPGSGYGAGPTYSGPTASPVVAIIAGVFALLMGVLPLLAGIIRLSHGRFGNALLPLFCGAFLIGGGIALILRTRIGQIVASVGAILLFVDGLVQIIMGYTLVIYALYIVAAIIVVALAWLPATAKAVRQTQLDSSAASPGMTQQYPQFPPNQPLPGQFPPGSAPPGQFPAGQMPPGQFPGQQQFPPGQFPGQNYPPRNY